MQGLTVMCRHTNLWELAREIHTYSGCVRYNAMVSIKAGNEPSQRLKFCKHASYSVLDVTALVGKGSFPVLVTIPIMMPGTGSRRARLPRRGCWRSSRGGAWPRRAGGGRAPAASASTLATPSSWCPGGSRAIRRSEQSLHITATDSTLHVCFIWNNTNYFCIIDIYIFLGVGRDFEI